MAFLRNQTQIGMVEERATNSNRNNNFFFSFLFFSSLSFSFLILPDYCNVSKDDTTKVDKRKKGSNPPRCHHKHLVKIFQFLSKLCHASYSSSFFMVPSVKNILLWRKVSFLFFSFFPFSSFPFSFSFFLFPFPFHSFSFNFHSSLRPSSFQLLFQFQNL